MTENLDILDDLIIGRVRPRIYAFSTTTFPAFLKVGDTYRPIRRRLDEWRRRYPDLELHFEDSASISDHVYFRDHSVHIYLDQDLGRTRLPPERADPGTYYSREFFESATREDVASAVQDIRRDHAEKGGRYTYFGADRLPVTHHYVRGPAWQLRPNQAEAVDRFVTAVEAGRTNLLMFAVMRFGKTFTSLMCAQRIVAGTVLIVSGKADVKGEWKQTVESAGNFEGFVFLHAEDLLGSAEAIADVRAKGKCAVVFLTLQDLQGPEIKVNHREVFSSDIDLLIIDETHFGARADRYGKVLREAGQVRDTTASVLGKADDSVAFEDADEQLKELTARVRLHLSGSPYRILMGSEFASEDIIATVQFADIVCAQEHWDADHPDANEWDNPYFGFPQMIRFAFNPNQSSRDKLKALKKSGVRYALAALLEPRSIARDSVDRLHAKFKHEAEIRDLLRVIDGSQQDENLLGFLDHDNIKQGEMCQHLVMVLPYCASCDAMEALVQQHADEFKNLQDYSILNISGLDGKRRYPKPQDVKKAIAEAAARNQKTLTLTVNRMLTGSTVEQWDTMLFLKDTASPQEYDQATFRIQSPHIRLLGSDTAGDVIRENLKPQTLLVDFDPNRLFQMQEQRSLISNARTADGGNEELSRLLQEDLRISPVITMNSDRLREVEPTDILEAVSQYNRNRSIADEARDVPADLGLLKFDEIRRVIELQAEIGSKSGLSLYAVEGEEDDLDIENPEPPDSTDTGRAPLLPPSNDAVDRASLEQKLQTYYQRILFFAMLSPDPVRSLHDVIDAIERGENERIARNLGLDAGVLRAVLAAFDPLKLNSLNYKIQNISRLAREESLTPVERATSALNKFTRISGSEVRTPLWFCRQIVDRIPTGDLRAILERGDAILDLASKSGEFALAFYERLVEDLELDSTAAKVAIFSIPTSGIAYEFTRRFYEILGLDVGHIAERITSYDLLSLPPDGGDAKVVAIIGSAFNEGSDAVKFGAVVGNPPYQESDGGAQASARPIYQRFVAAASALDPEFVSFVIPSRWYFGGKSPLEEFRATMLADRHVRELHDFPNPETVFPETNNRGGICFFLRDANYDTRVVGGTRVFTRHGPEVEFEMVRPLNTLDLGVFLRDSEGVGIVRKVTSSRDFVSFEGQVSSRKPFGLEANIVRSPQFHATPVGLSDPVRCFGKSGSVGYVERALVSAHHEWIERRKVFTPYANNLGTERPGDNQNAFVVESGSVCSESFIVMGVGLELTEKSAANLVKYLKSKFARYLHSMAKISQHGTKATYRFVPVVDVSDDCDIDWAAPGEMIEDQLFDAYELTAEERNHIRAAIKPM